MKYLFLLAFAFLTHPGSAQLADEQSPAPPKNQAVYSPGFSLATLPMPGNDKGKKDVLLGQQKWRISSNHV